MLRVTAALITSLVLVTSGGAAWSAPPLRVCLLENNLPYSERASDAGFDVAVAKAVALEIGVAFEAVWTVNSTRITEIESDFPMPRLKRGACDAIFSVPGPASAGLGGDAALALGQPYYGAAFELIACGDEVSASLPDLKAKTVAIQAQSIAHFALLELAAEPVSYFSLAAAHEGVAAGENTAGLLWGPGIGWRLLQTQQSASPRQNACAIVDGYTPPSALSWNLHVATRAADSELRTRIDQALARISARGELAVHERAFGVPAHAPFAATYSQAALRALKR